MLPLLVLLFVVVPMLEIYVIIQVGHALGVLDTIAVMVLISLLGAWLARHEGFVVLQRARESLDLGRIPADEILDGTLVLAGGLLLLTPGFVTDGVGVALLFPPTRAMVRAYLRRYLRTRLGTSERGRF